jgi:hypothetical protein
MSSAKKRAGIRELLKGIPKSSCPRVSAREFIKILKSQQDDGAP